MVTGGIGRYRVPGGVHCGGLEFYAGAVVEKILDSARKLPNFPLAGRIVPELEDETIRERFVYSYRLIYRIYGDKITVLAVSSMANGCLIRCRTESSASDRRLASCAVMVRQFSHCSSYYEGIKRGGRSASAEKNLQQDLQEEYPPQVCLNESEVEPEDTGSDELITKPFDPTLIRVEPKLMTVDLLIIRMRENEIDLLPGFQRRDDVWKEGAQSRLIESLLIRIPLP